MQCDQCQHVNRDTARFCAACASPLGTTCAACGNQNPSGAVFCDHCATPLTADTTAARPTQPTRPGGWVAVRFHAVLPAVIGLLRYEGRVTYRTLAYILGLDEVLLREIRENLSFRQLAIDEDGQGLVWIGETHPTVQRAATAPVSQATPDTTRVTSSATHTLPPVALETTTPSTASPVAPDGIPSVAADDEPVAPEPARNTLEAERRHLTVMFCDLPDSTKLSQQLDPEDLRAVIRAYQATAAEVIQQYEGYIAQYLGDGLLVYFGWPVAHEDDVARAVHTGLGIIEAIRTRLNPRLIQDKGVQLAVRIGIHTGPVVVGEMGGGSRHEHLATGETVNIAARLEGLAQPNTMMISSVTARLVERFFALEDLGLQRLKGVAEPMQVFRVRGSMEVEEDERIPSVSPSWWDGTRKWGCCCGAGNRARRA